jgi:hypothetical protein
MPLTLAIPFFSISVFFIWLIHIVSTGFKTSIFHGFISPLSIIFYFTILYYIIGVPLFYLSTGLNFLNFDFTPFLAASYLLQFVFILFFSIPFFTLNYHKYKLHIPLKIEYRGISLAFCLFAFLVFLDLFFLYWGKTKINYYGITFGGRSESHVLSTFGFLLPFVLLPFSIYFYMTKRFLGLLSLLIYISITFPFGFRGILFLPFLSVLLIEFLNDYDKKLKFFIPALLVIFCGICLYGLTRSYFNSPNFSNLEGIEGIDFLFGFFNDSNIVLTQSVLIYYLNSTSNFIGINDYLISLKYFLNTDFTSSIVTSLDLINQTFSYYDFVFDAPTSGAAIPLTGSIYAMQGWLFFAIASSLLGFISFSFWANIQNGFLGRFLYLCLAPWFFNLNIRGYAPQAIADFIFILSGIIIVLLSIYKIK